VPVTEIDQTAQLMTVVTIEKTADVKSQPVARNQQAEEVKVEAEPPEREVLLEEISVELVLDQGEPDWAALTSIAKASYVEKNEAKEAAIRQQLFTFDDAESYFLNVSIKLEPIKDPQANCLSRMFSCFRSTPVLKPGLSHQREIFFALAKLPLQI
jgi:hypothetical protein